MFVKVDNKCDISKSLLSNGYWLRHDEDGIR